MKRVLTFMSHQAVKWALDGTGDLVATPTEVAVLVSLMEFADRNGLGAFPAVATVARRARCSTRTVRRVFRKLLDRGVLEDGGISPSGTRVYHAPRTRRYHDPIGLILAEEAS